MAGAAIAATLLAVAGSSGGSTYAAFSDYELSTGHRVGAGHVKIGVSGPGAVDLAYTDVLPDVVTTATVRATYSGTMPGDVAVVLRPAGGSAFCTQGSSGAWTPNPGGSLQVAVAGGSWLDYCSLLDTGASTPVASGVAPGTTLDVPVALRLAPGTDWRYGGLVGQDVFRLGTRQTGVGAFSDWVIGAIRVATSEIEPEIPAACGPVSQYREIVRGGPGIDVIVAGNGKQIVLGYAAGDVLDGGNGKDCLVGGSGNDVLIGWNGKDIMVGGTGWDTCKGGLAPGEYHGCEVTLFNPLGLGLQADQPDDRSRSAQAREPETAEAQTAEPATAEPQTAEPETTEPEPEPAEPESTEPETTEPEPTPAG